MTEEEATIPDFLLLLYPFTQEQIVNAYLQFNSWQWPDILAAHKPENYDNLHRFNSSNREDKTTKEGHPWHGALRTALKICTSEWQRSWAHNQREVWRGKGPNMTPERHREWWKENYNQ